IKSYTYHRCSIDLGRGSCGGWQFLPGKLCRFGAERNQSLTIGRLARWCHRNRPGNRGSGAMAVEAEVAEGAEPAGRKRFNLKLLLIAGALLVLLGAGATYYFVIADGGRSGNQIAAVPDTFIFNLPAMTVNLNSDGEGEQFMKLTVALEVASEEVMLEIQPRMGKVVDAFQVYLRELRKSDLEGSAGIYRLKEELQRRVNVAVYPAQVESVLFKEILVQ